MSIISEISRIENAASIIKDKVSELGLSVSSPSKLDNCANAIDSIAKRTAVNSTLTSASSSVHLSSGYYGNDSTISVSVMQAPAITLSSASQTISCDDKMIDGDIVIPAANLFYTGSNAPTGSTPGNDGDLYIVV